MCILKAQSIVHKNRPLIIETPRTTIQHISEQHSALLSTYFIENVSHLEKWEPNRSDSFYELKQIQKRIVQQQDDYTSNKALSLVVLNKKQSKIIANINFSNIIFGPFQACYLGFSIDSQLEGQGIMLETLDASIKHVFETYRLNRIIASYMPSNKRSEKTLQKLGFQQEGYAKAYLKINGKWEDHILNSLLCSDFLVL